MTEINQRLDQHWKDNEVVPSDIADDEEWLRRVYLDLTGRIPSTEEVRRFLGEKEEAPSRTQIIEELLSSDEYISNWTTVWTNLSIGRQTPRRVSRRGMEKFYREAFARNRPWNEVVTDLILAEGHYEENGAVNYLLAQMTMRDEQVLLTAKTAKLFLGQQLQCVQCHNHPFNQWKQEQFWQFNSFFRQIDKIDHRKIDPDSGRRVDDYSEVVLRDFSGPVHFDRRDGLKQVAYPIFNGESVNPDVTTDRREGLTSLLAQGERPAIASAMVNRMWSHFFGYGFVNPVDDIGPHNHSAMPELFDRMADEFVKNNYDVKKLMNWIVNSKAYNLTSKFNPGNEFDDPAAGETPLFSKMYLKSLEAEQLYDSLLVATRADAAGRADYEEQLNRREQWLRQFVIEFGNDEGTEATTFNGTIPQALMLMNGQLVRNAMSMEGESFLQQLKNNSKLKPLEKVNEVYLATLNRYPTSRERSALTKLFKGNPEEAALQDLLWALLNSNEFITNH
ncbi:DUF1549 domain-containing protein [Polystyrenella longa]|uniref:DUF1549 domain-containing protein n=1 Tax=Polystyrenella longa TaxID=2528007 RepID=UPI0018D1FF13|nr:DUF1549 domain-containing protein [Polystyrenella longa]